MVAYFLLLFFSAFFSGTEAAFFTLDETKLKEQAKSDPSFHGLLKLLQNQKRVTTTLTIGNTMSNLSVFVVSIFLTDKIVRDYQVLPALAHSLNALISLLVVMLLGENLPKLLASIHPEKVSKLAAPFVLVGNIIFYPLSTIVIFLTKIFEKVTVRIKGMKSLSVSSLTNEEIKALAESGLERGELTDTEHLLIENILDFREQIVRKIMTPRADICAIDTEASWDELVELIRNKKISKIPLYEDDLDNILGVLHAKDLVKFTNAKRQLKPEDWHKNARPPIFVPETQRLDDLLKTFQKKHTQVAIVVDEYGGTSGIVTLDDIIQEILGELAATPPSQADYKQIGTDCYRFDARIPIEEAFEVLNLPIHHPNKESDYSDDFDTLGGFILNLCGGIPNEKQHIQYENLDIEIEKILGQRILSVIICTKQTSPPNPSQET
ncbi:CBS domain containing protein [Chloroherpeton thalassium ATCC 35110]|uniref:CBS domain containing protein n=1 Tax=Chloroherpeton thalassium (strain ATCC 35110 / GB-78) TaxID=517418 RepID=B3QY17_CHLT3|nr:hemolysin family protein [Chloroherpeton thalassium]ACF13545.1 CBS domain containing protein [Chloroherpeton thalassium ATCC 35110]